MFINSLITIGGLVFLVIFIPWAIYDGTQQKDEIKQMDCKELKNYILDKTINGGGFTGMAKDLFKFKCEVIDYY